MMDCLKFKQKFDIKEITDNIFSLKGKMEIQGLSKIDQINTIDILIHKLNFIRDEIEVS
jgi:hypothetical protein